MNLNVIHIASFVGNIGDNAMHDGAYRARSEDCSCSYHYDRHEVRDYYHWRRRAFDEAFVHQANAADLVMIGGFSLFQLWRENSRTGTYLDLPIDFFAKISTPVLFYGVGVDVSRPVNDHAVEKCREFLDFNLNLEQCRFSLRNDGSRNEIEAALGSAYAGAMDVIPDGGLFANPGKTGAFARSPSRKYIAVNLAGDMADVRYVIDGKTDAQDDFIANFVSGIEDLLVSNGELDCVFVPNIYSDLGVISRVLDAMDDRLRRSRVFVAPYVQGDDLWHANFDIYRSAEVVVAMRYHPCLTAIGFGTPIFGISTHHKIAGQFDAYGLQDRYFDWTGDLLPLFAAVASELQVGSDIRQRMADIRAGERQCLRDFHRNMEGWLAELRKCGVSA